MLINARYGPFYIPNGHDLIAQSLRLYGEWAQLEIDVLANFIQDGDVVADIGSFIGSHQGILGGGWRAGKGLRI